MNVLSGSKGARLVDVTPKKRQLEEIQTKKADSGGVSHTHHFNDGSKPETHLSKNAKAAGHHVAQSFGAVARGTEPTPDEASGVNQAPPQAALMAEMPGQGA
jgi:hypothetical protein